MSDMFGMTGGFRQYAFDQAAMREAQQNEALRAGQIQEAQATAQLRQAQAAQAEAQSAALAQRRELMQAAMGAIGGQETPSTNPMVAQLGQMSRGVDALIMSGDIEGASKLLKELSQVRSSLSTSAAQDELTERRRVQSELDKLRVVRETMSRVTNAQEFEAAKMFLQANPVTAMDELPPEMGQYNPDYIRALVTGSAEEERKIRLDLEKGDKASLEAQRAAATNEARKRTEIMKSRAEAYIDRANRVSSAGGDFKVPAPRAAEIKAINERLTGFGLGTKKGLVADYLAREALEQVARFPNLTFNAAADKVIKEAMDRGDLKKGVERSFGFDTEGSFASSQGSVSDPIPVAEDMPRKEGAYYQAGDGTLAVLRNGRLVPVAPPRRQQVSNPFLESDEVGEDE